MPPTINASIEIRNIFSSGLGSDWDSPLLNCGKSVSFLILPLDLDCSPGNFLKALLPL